MLCGGRKSLPATLKIAKLQYFPLPSFARSIGSQMIYAYTRLRYQVSVYRTIGPLVSLPTMLIDKIKGVNLGIDVSIWLDLRMLFSIVK